MNRGANPEVVLNGRLIKLSGTGSWFKIWFSNWNSWIMRKPVFGVCVQEKLTPAC